MRYLALGDSYTIGEGVEPRERWPELLRDALVHESVPLDSPQMIARTGWTTDELAAAIAAESPSGTFELVSLLIGVNNQYRGRTCDEYREEFRGLLDQAIGFAGDDAAGVLVLSIPDWSVTPFAKERDRSAIRDAIDAFNVVNREEAVRRHVRYVDVTPCSRAAAADAALTAADGLHPSGAMYARWAALALPEAHAAFAEGGPRR